MGLKEAGLRGSLRNISTGAEYVPPSGLARWTFDDADTSGSTATDVWAGNDGTITGATTGASGANQTYTTNEAYSFDGTDDYVTVPNGIFSGLSEYTVAFWINFGVINDGNFHTGVAFVEDALIQFRQDQDGTIRFRQQNDQANAFAVTSSATAGTWTHWMCIWDGSQIELFKDNTSQGTAAISSMNTTQGDGNGIAVYNPSSPVAHLEGDMDDVRVFDKALSSTERSDLYNNGSIA